jgi:carboxyl-terminal processing protease
VIDLRDNGGGSLSAAIDMLDYMLPAGDLITEKSTVNGDTLYQSTDEEHFDKPVAILMNANSASASEVFAGCMQDRGGATLVGVQSFGKGIVQTIFSLEKSCGGGIKLTTGEYLLPSKRSIQGEGLTPDVEVKYTGSSQELGARDDNQLKKAVSVLKEKI